jgi:uroporphyrinogen decarboxylase
MRKYVFPWHKKIVEVAHENKKPAILHSCGNAGEIMDDIIDGIKFNGKHSFEDVIMPVEENYKIWGKRVGIIGGMDVDFLIRSSPEEIKNRCEAMLELAEENGSYALGSGNSVPEYIPYEHYRAMIDVALSKR